MTYNWHFDTQIILEFLKRGFRIKEVPIPTYYGDEICHVNGIPYAMHCAAEAVKYATLHRWKVQQAKRTRTSPNDDSNASHASPASLASRADRSAAPATAPAAPSSTPNTRPPRRSITGFTRTPGAVTSRFRGGCATCDLARSWTSAPPRACSATRSRAPG